MVRSNAIITGFSTVILKIITDMKQTQHEQLLVGES